jgi:hypothetical protein
LILKSNGPLPELLNAILQIFSKVTCRGQQFGMTLWLKTPFCKSKLNSRVLPRSGNGSVQD